MKWGVEGAVAAVADVGMHVDKVVDLLGIQLTRRITLATTMDSLEGTDQLKREMRGRPLRGVALVGRAVPSVVVLVAVLAMERMLKENVHVGHMNAAVGLDVG